MLYEIAKRLVTFEGDGICLRPFGACFVLTTPNWTIYLSSKGEQFNKKLSKWTMERVGTCPDELVIAHKLLGVLIEQERQYAKTL